MLMSLSLLQLLWLWFRISGVLGVDVAVAVVVAVVQGFWSTAVVT